MHTLASGQGGPGSCEDCCEASTGFPICAGEARSSVVPFLQARVSFAGQQGAAETPLHCSPVLCTPSSRPTEDHCPGLAGLTKSNPLELGSITEVGMIASHRGRKRQGPPHCCQQDASTLQFASHSTILARPELILHLLFFLQSGCLAGLQGWQGALLGLVEPEHGKATAQPPLQSQVP